MRCSCENVSSGSRVGVYPRPEREKMAGDKPLSYATIAFYLNAKAIDGVFQPRRRDRNVLPISWQVNKVEFFTSSSR